MLIKKRDASSTGGAAKPRSAAPEHYAVWEEERGLVDKIKRRVQPQTTIADLSRFPTE